MDRKTTRTVRQIARCTRCKLAAVREVVRTTTEIETRGMYPRRHIDERLPDGRHLSHDARECCGRLLHFQAIDGRKTDTPCDHRCTGATGHHCECSCGGRNHGAAHA